MNYRLTVFLQMLALYCLARVSLDAPPLLQISLVLANGLVAKSVASITVELRRLYGVCGKKTIKNMSHLETQVIPKIFVYVVVDENFHYASSLRGAVIQTNDVEGVLTNNYWVRSHAKQRSNLSRLKILEIGL